MIWVHHVDNEHGPVLPSAVSHRVYHRIVEHGNPSLCPPMPFTTHDQVHHVRLRDVDTEVQPQVVVGECEVGPNNGTRLHSLDNADQV